MTKKKPENARKHDGNIPRKPKNKLISKSAIQTPAEPATANIILHLRCSFQDLEEYNLNYNKQLTDPMFYTPQIPPNIQTYNSTTFATNSVTEQPACSFIDYAYPNDADAVAPFICSACSLCGSEIVSSKTDKNTNNETKEYAYEKEKETHIITEMDIQQKLKQLKYQLFKKKITNKKSACFWCTYEFDNIECYIPTFENDGNICGYGSFCRPECAVAYLMEEHIDDSVKFERFHWINQIYGKIYGYTKNIKPAPNPHYLLEKFYGNLSIQEYRKLLKSDHLLMIVEKPLTRILPELHEDMDDCSVQSNAPHLHSVGEIQYKVKKSTDKNHRIKNNIIKEHFGLGTAS